LTLKKQRELGKDVFIKGLTKEYIEGLSPQWKAYLWALGNKYDNSNEQDIMLNTIMMPCYGKTRNESRIIFCAKGTAKRNIGTRNRACTKRAGKWYLQGTDVEYLTN
jgi:hypothetical protein